MSGAVTMSSDQLDALKSSPPDSAPSGPSGRSGRGNSARPAPGELPPDSQMDFAGWGTVEKIDDVSAGALQPLDSPAAHHKLGEVASTAICGNDITSSCLYVAALATLYGGKYGFICLAAVAAILYLFRNIYAEVGTALPLNGGAYNALLNTTSKYRASIAAKRVKVVHVYSNEDDVDREKLSDQLRTIDQVYPELRVDLVLVQGKFGPELIEKLSKRLGVPKNHMFLGTPGDRFPHNIADLGGVRLII